MALPLAGAAAAILTHSGESHAQVAVTQRGYTSDQAGTDYWEPVLTQSNVKAGQFGKLFSLTTDNGARDTMQAQILYLPHLHMWGQAVGSNVVFVATSNNTVYAIDADRGTRYWTAQLPVAPTGGSGPPGCNQDHDATAGIISTPVIDTSTGTMYVVAPTLEPGVNPYSIYAINIFTGGWGGMPLNTNPAPSYHGVTFNSFYQNQRTALALVGNTVFAAFGSMCDDPEWHGWVMGFDKSSLLLTGVWASTTAQSAGGIWQSGQGLVTGVQPGSLTGSPYNLWLATGNGNYDGVSDFSMSVVELSASPDGNGYLPLLGSFTPANWATWGGGQGQPQTPDNDISANGPMFVPTSPGNGVIVQGGKDGELYSMNYNLIGLGKGITHYEQGEKMKTNAVLTSPNNGLMFGGGVGGFMNWSNSLFTYYIWGSNDFVRPFVFDDPNLSEGKFRTGIPGTVQTQYSQAGMTLSTNNGASNTGILWATQMRQLWAFNADDVRTTLWHSNAAIDALPVGTCPPMSPDSCTLAPRNTPPTVASGKVYVPMFSGPQLPVYGLHPVFWGQDFGYPQWNPLGYDWAPNDYKGECQLGQPVTGISAFPPWTDSGQQGHAILCSNAIATTTSCRPEYFDSRNSPWDWDSRYAKAQCPDNFFLQGVAQTSGYNGTVPKHMDRILCCPSVSPSSLAASSSNCTVEVFQGQNSSHYSDPDWDNNFYKGECQSGYVAMGVSNVFFSSLGPVGAPHALLCCQPH